MRDRGLQGVETVIERHQGVTAERDEDGFLFDREHR
jgi:hypothetical protein